MTTYRIAYRTVSTYARRVPFARHCVRLLPGDGPRQRVAHASLRVEPAPAERVEATDFFGNRIAWITLDTPHDRFEVVLDAQVGVQPGPDEAALAATPAWEQVRDAALDVESLAADAPAHYLFPSARVPLFAQATEHARACFAPGRPIGEAALAFAQAIHREFGYEPGVTDAGTDAVQAFAQRRGVCQDFAHVMLAALRGLALPAAYVSGFLRTAPPPGEARLEGADAMHAWVRVWAGPAHGWLAFDPTNGIAASEGHITVAIGRDYADVAPIDGVIVAPGGQSYAVAADVVPID